MDENLPSKLAKHINRAGYSATSVELCGLSGQNDRAIFSYARKHQLTIITSDSDFLSSNLFPLPHAGIVVLQFPHKTQFPFIISMLLAKLGELNQLNLASHTYIVDMSGIRLYR